jgi:hypothetical protein
LRLHLYFSCSSWQTLLVQLDLVLAGFCSMTIQASERCGRKPPSSSSLLFTPELLRIHVSCLSPPRAGLAFSSCSLFLSLFLFPLGCEPPTYCPCAEPSITNLQYQRSRTALPDFLLRHHPPPQFSLGLLSPPLVSILEITRTANHFPFVVYSFILIDRPTNQPNNRPTNQTTDRPTDQFT